MAEATEIPDLSGLGNAMKPLADLGKQMTSSKMKEAYKGLNNMFTSMSESSFQAAEAKALHEILGPIIKLFEIFNPIFEALGALLEVSLIPLFKLLQPVITAVSKAIIFLMPYIKGLSEFIINSLVVAFKVIANAFGWLWNEILVPFGNFLKTVFIGIWNSVIFAGKVLANIFITVYNAVAWVWDKIATVVEWIVEYVGFGWLWGGVDLPRMATVEYLPLQRGGLVYSPKRAMIAEREPEVVTPLSRISEITGMDEVSDKLDTLISLTRDTIRMQKEENRFKIRGE